MKSSDELIWTYQEANKRYLIAKNDRYQIFQLAQVDDPRVPEVFVEALSDDDAHLRHFAALGIVLRSGKIRFDQWQSERDQYLPLLLKLVEAGQETAPAVGHTLMTCIALAKVGGVKVSDIIIQALASSNADIRQSARNGLYVLLEDDEAALPYILKELESDNLMIRSGAAWALCRFNSTFKTRVTQHLLAGLQIPELKAQFQIWLDELDGISTSFKGVE